jgi:hypothetical protein
MYDIGFHYSPPPKANPDRPFSPSLINRIALLESRLRPYGFRLFVHSPRDVSAEHPTVPGFVFDDGELTPVRAPVPRVNGNWSSRTRRMIEEGMGYEQFGRWTARNGIRIYVPHAFSELLGDKLETYKLVRGYHEALHPHCEPFGDSMTQLEHFVASGHLTFIKPRGGSQGNRIVTLRRDGNGLRVTRYYKGRRREANARTTREALESVRAALDPKRKYLIQHGVETMRHEGSTFDIRVTMLNDGSRWHWLHEARLSPSGSDVSNVSQGGEILPTENLLFDLAGPEASADLLHEIQSESFGLAAYLERLHPGEVLEIAFDFAVGGDGRPYLLEVNTKPGLAGIGSNVSVFDKRPEHEPMFERWVYPHVDCLARFLRTKAGACLGT